MFLSHMSITFLKALLNISLWKAISKAAKVKVNKVLNLFLPNCDLDYNMTSSWLRNLQLMMFNADWLQWSTSVHKAQRNAVSMLWNSPTVTSLVSDHLHHSPLYTNQAAGGWEVRLHPAPRGDAAAAPMCSCSRSSNLSQHNVDAGTNN